jgi:hypothetical protein
MGNPLRVFPPIVGESLSFLPLVHQGEMISPLCTVAALSLQDSSSKQGTVRCAALYALAFRPHPTLSCLPTVAPRGDNLSRLHVDYRAWYCGTTWY